MREFRHPSGHRFGADLDVVDRTIGGQGGIADIVRQWWRLRYALIPYIEEQARAVIASGLPVLRALLLQYPDDPVVWHIDDEYLFGNDLLVAPVMNDAGARRVYFPEDEWVDFWTGERITGPV